MNAIFEFRSVAFSAPPKDKGAQPITIILDATFELVRGTLTVIAGPSGAGKSTLLRLFNRLADPTSGVILFEGKDIRDFPVKELRRRIGWVPQVPVRFPGTVEDNLRLPFTVSKAYKFTQEEIEVSIQELKALNLLREELFLRKADDLSVGEAQRLNLLRALALKPDVVLLDEPTSALDPDASEQLLAQIERVRSERSLTAILVSHRPNEVAKLGDVVLRLADGRVHLSAVPPLGGTTGGALNRPTLGGDYRGG